MRAVVLFLVVAACSSSGSSGGGSTPTDGGTTTTGSSTSSSSSSSSGGAGDSGPCASDPLKTGIVAQQTGVSADAFDCAILKGTAQYNEPDAMIFKAIIYVESRFDTNAAACPNLPCGTPAGWTAAESGCYGLMQIVPACGGDIQKIALLPDGHPNMTKDTGASAYAGSVFNPDVNVAIGIAGLADNRAQVKKKFPGCTEDQYTLMAMGDYNSYGSTKSCTQYNTDYDNLVLTTYREYAAAAGYAAHPY